MPTATTRSYATIGIDARIVEIEVHVSAGLPAFNIVGMAETAVRESRERVRSAIINSGFEFPSRRITVNLAPADLPKQGGGFDLAIAVAVLMATEQLPIPGETQCSFAGELSLSGELRASKGLLPIALASASDNRDLICADDGNIQLELLDSEGAIYPADTLLAVCSHLLKKVVLPPLHRRPPCVEAPRETRTLDEDLNQIQGQLVAKKALEISAAGRHNLLFVGPPGAGKSMLAKRMVSILPNLNREAAIGTAVIYSVSGRSRPSVLAPPVRSPHHSATAASLVGGGSSPSPGEVSLAHNGVLFLDELPEFAPKVLEGLREPLENGEISISRANYQSLFPADFQLISAMNPCPCGYFGSARCDCSPERVIRYQRRISGPLLDRIDMQVQVEAPEPSTLLRNNTEQRESSFEVKQRVIEARDLQIRRQGKTNSKLSAGELKDLAPLNAESEKILDQAMHKLDLSARGLHKILRVARTIADLEKAEFDTSHIKQALSFRERKVPR